MATIKLVTIHICYFNGHYTRLPISSSPVNGRINGHGVSWDYEGDNQQG